MPNLQWLARIVAFDQSSVAFRRGVSCGRCSRVTNCIASCSLPGSQFMILYLRLRFLRLCNGLCCVWILIQNLHCMSECWTSKQRCKHQDQSVRIFRARLAIICFHFMNLKCRCKHPRERVIRSICHLLLFSFQFIVMVIVAGVDGLYVPVPASNAFGVITKFSEDLSTVCAAAHALAMSVDFGHCCHV